MSEKSALLQVSNLRKHFKLSSNMVADAINSIRGEESAVHALKGVNLSVKKNEIVGVIGESGCGKSTLIETIIGLYEPTEGSITYKGQKMSTFSKKDWNKFRKETQIVFQDPYNSIDPKMTIREAIREPLEIHGISHGEDEIVDTLEKVNLNPPREYLDRRPNQLSGGQLQRVALARALIMEPELILADEPLSMLDVSTQASILNLLNELREEMNFSMIYISHDLSTISYICDSIKVMYLGEMVESAPTKRLVENPKHPYSQALIDAIPIPDPHYHREPTELPIRAEVESNDLTGCIFKHRCPERMEICDMRPRSIDIEDSHDVACHLYYDHEKNLQNEEIPSS